MSRSITLGLRRGRPLTQGGPQAEPGTPTGGELCQGRGDQAPQAGVPHPGPSLSPEDRPQTLGYSPASGWREPSPCLIGRDPGHPAALTTHSPGPPHGPAVGDRDFQRGWNPCGETPEPGGCPGRLSVSPPIRGVQILPPPPGKGPPSAKPGSRQTPTASPQAPGPQSLNALSTAPELPRSRSPSRALEAG